jgi:hypothetical protein
MALVFRTGNGVRGVIAHSENDDHGHGYNRCHNPCNPCNPCNKPYIVSGTGCDCCPNFKLCVSPDPCLMSDSKFKELFCVLKDGIIYNRFDTLLANLTSSSYGAFYALCVALADKVAPEGRVVVTLPDGTVVVDTYQGASNTWSNYQDKSINENHNTRVAIFRSQYEQCGVGHERKLSSTTWVMQKSVAIRLGEYLNSAGSIRISVDDVPL